jgi:hypothetical protein
LEAECRLARRRCSIGGGDNETGYQPPRSKHYSPDCNMNTVQHVGRLARSARTVKPQAEALHEHLGRSSWVSAMWARQRTDQRRRSNVRLEALLQLLRMDRNRASSRRVLTTLICTTGAL